MISSVIGAVLLIALPALRADVTVETSCPSEAVRTVGKTFFGIKDNVCFMFMTYDEVKYATALSKCQINQGTLAMPKTKDVNDFLLQEMKRLGHRKPMWIGMHDKAIEGEYVWEDGTEVKPWGNMDWTNGGAFGGGEDCIALDPRDRKWYDYRCSVYKFPANIGLFGNEKLPFICQYPIKSDAQNDVKIKQDKIHDDKVQGDNDDSDQGKGDKDDDDQGKGATVDDGQGKGDKTDDGQGQGNKTDDGQGQGNKTDDGQGQGNKTDDDKGQGDKTDDGQRQALRADVTVETSCPSEEVRTVGKTFFGINDNVCFMFMTYDEVKYATALSKCQINQGTLAMPKTKDVNDFLLQEMKRLGHRKPMWIGMHDKAMEGEYVWEDGTEVKPWGNMDWTNGGAFGGGEDCIALDPRDRKWYDYRCSVYKFPANIGLFDNEKLPFICQYPIKSDPQNDDKIKQGKIDDDKVQGDNDDSVQGKGDKDDDDQGKGATFDDGQGQGNKTDNDKGQGDKTDDDQGQGNKTDDDQGQGNKTDDDQGQGDKTDDDEGQGNKTDDDQGQGNKTYDDQGQGDKTDDDKGQGNKSDDDQGQGNKTDDDDKGQGAKTDDDKGQGNKTDDDQGQGNKTYDDQGQGDKTDDDKGQGDKIDDDK